MDAAHPAAPFEYVLRLGDNALVLSQRLSEWCGKGPALEEDMALTNVALDLIGQARLWLSYAGELEGAGPDTVPERSEVGAGGAGRPASGTDVGAVRPASAPTLRGTASPAARGEDELAFLRDAGAFRNLLLVEQPNGSYADTLMRQFLFDAWHAPALRALAASADPRIAEIAAKAQKEVAYHLRRSSDLVVRLGDGTDRSRAMMQAALDQLWPYTGEMFQADAVDRAAAASGAGFDPAALRAPWLEYLGEVFAAATLRLPPADAWMHSGGKQGRHTEKLGYLLAEMQFLQRAYPGARW